MSDSRLYGGVFRLDRPCVENAMRIDMGIVEPIARMNRLGIFMDTARMEVIHRETVAGYEEALAGVQAAVFPTFNPNSSQQVGRLLFEEMGLVPPTGFKYTKGGVEKSDTDTLLALMSQAVTDGNEEVQRIIGYRGDKTHKPSGILGCKALRKRAGTYTGPDALRRYLDYDGRLRTEFSTTRARTGRLASSNPNLQNIDPPVRDAFIAEERQGRRRVLTSHDMSQIEMIWAGELSADACMIDIFINGHDMHAKTACAIFGLNYEEIRPLWSAYKAGKLIDAAQYARMRAFETTQRLPAKTLGFAILYGATAQALQVQIVSAGGPLLDIATIAELIDNWYVLYSGVRRWMELQISRARRFGMVCTAFGRPRAVPEVRSSLARVSSGGERKTGNTPIQGSAGDHLKIALAQGFYTVVKYFQKYGYCELLLQIHDELITEVDEDIDDDYGYAMKDVIENCVQLYTGIPVKSSFQKARTWAGLK